jgi:DNA-binding transcriptional regulator YiaG
MNDQTWTQRILTLRVEHLQLNQQYFAGALGLSVSGVSNWENGLTVPQSDNLGVLIVTLVESVLNDHPPSLVVRALTGCGRNHLQRVRVLTCLERREKLPPLLTHGTPSTWRPERIPRPEWIRGMRQKLKLSQHHFAHVLSFTIAVVSRWELGKSRALGALRGSSLSYSPTF